MRWNKFTLKTRSEVEDIVISTLAEAGVEGVEIEDKVPLTEQDKQQMFVDILPDGPADDGIAYLNFYLDEKEDKEELLANVKDALEELRMFVDIGEGTITESQTEDKDWINNWKQYFHQFYVDDILIIPSWEEVKPEDKDKMIIHIDPGTAFGTGMHETTQLCMRQLKKYVKDGMEILDVGTGSGILSIAALKLGAGHAVGTDLDPCAISATRENLEANQIPEGSMDVMIGNIIDDKAVQDQVGYEKYDIVTANILADVLIPLTPVICHQMKPGALYITSGILDVKEDVVVKAVKDAGLEVLEVTHQGEWVSVTARNQASDRRKIMYDFFADSSAIGEKEIIIRGSDLNHMKNVLRLQIGEQICIHEESTGKEYRCEIAGYEKDVAHLHIMWVEEANRELPSKIYLFQGLPKGDKMELIIQKAVELGVYEIIPVATKRAVVKLDAKKAEAKQKRWQSIAESAAKQSRRNIIPHIHEVVKFGQAVDYAKNLDITLIPYELAEDMEKTKQIFETIQPGQSIGIFIGPEGGFDESEIALAQENGISPITLGKRILRTETAGMAVLSVLMFQLEGRE